MAIELIIEDRLTGRSYGIKVRGKNELEIDRRENVWKARELYQAMLEGELEKPVNFDEIVVEEVSFYYLHFVGDNSKKHVKFLLEYFNEEQWLESYIWNDDTKYAAFVIPNYHFETTKFLSVLHELELIKAQANKKEDTQTFLNILKIEATRIPQLLHYIESKHQWLMFKKGVKNFFNELRELRDIYKFHTHDKQNKKSRKEEQQKKVEEILKKEE